ncbi:hypothetical protein A0H81_05828 [Grifola frondosa]|uniref:Uncharacterized protein n=1 Tax=Grifola frondosa TaxID=5627 RepID=A0A1C7MAG9_GRIFR|nr:hypothetical protein A0H81_05828 [Grifola frondosa]
MSDRRRAEIEAKKAKLAELRKAIADRKAADTERRLSSFAGPSVRRRLASIICSWHAHTRQSDAASSDRVSVGTTLIHSANGTTDHGIERVVTPRMVPDLIDVEQELFELPQKERVIYNKEVQTMEIETEPATISEEEMRERILQEREVAEAERQLRDEELEAESIKLEEEIAQEIREMTEEERSSIFSAPEFLDFVEQSTKLYSERSTIATTISATTQQVLKG